MRRCDFGSFFTCVWIYISFCAPVIVEITIWGRTIMRGNVGTITSKVTMNMNTTSAIGVLR